MNYNPYAAPSAGAAPAGFGGPGAGRPQPWEVGEVYGRAWESFKPNWAVLVFTTLTAMAIELAIGSIPNVLKWTGVLEANSLTASLVAIAAFVPQWALAIFFRAGLIRIGVDAARGGEPPFAALASGGSTYFRLLGAIFLVALVLVASMLALVLPIFYVGVRIMFTPYFVVDGQMGPVEALKASWNATRGQYWKLVLLAIVDIAVILLGAAACCLGFFAAVPLAYLATAIVYLRISGRGTPAPITPAYTPPARYAPY